VVSICKIASLGYYEKLAQEDYWSRGSHHGLWSGKGAQALGLSGVVDTQMMERLFRGFSPDGSRALVRNAGSRQRSCGFDLCASASKGFSVLWALSDEETRRALEHIQAKAVEETISYLEDQVASMRTGKGGIHHEHAGLVVAIFNHYTSRNHDAQVHSHLLVMNVGVADGKTNALYSPALYQTKLIGSVYRASLAWHLQQDLGIEVERHGDLFEIKGMPEPLLRAFSTRRQTIEDTLQAHGWHSAKASAMATLTTRPQKLEVVSSFTRDCTSAVRPECTSQR
jgi:conjugative relaxase-like TrwC/TraI family protein